ncbi:hypothetical protein PM082_022873 [Marasmius tenuissimus]|nr:hypothetical protein PM082_022873 [Marasmius tenuissimus]
MSEGKWSVWYYLWYTQQSSFDALDNDNTLTIPVSYRRNLWTFNPRTHAWQYDVASAAILPPDNNDTLDPIYYSGTPLCQDTPPQLDTDEIVACFEEQLGDFLYPIASFGETRHVKDLSDFARHGYLNFGTVVDRTKPEILAYLASAHSPDWYCENYTANVKASYSSTDGREYAQAYGYPELIHGDPHNPRTNVIEELNAGQDLNSSAKSLDAEGESSPPFLIVQLLNCFNLTVVASSGQEPDSSSNNDMPTNMKHPLDQALEVVAHHEVEAVATPAPPPPIQEVAKGLKEHVLHKTGLFERHSKFSTSLNDHVLAPIPSSPGDESKPHRPAMRKASNRIRSFRSTLANHCQRIFVGFQRSKKEGSTHQPSEEEH